METIQVAERPGNTLASSSPASQEKGTLESIKDWIYEKIWGKPASCPSNALYEEALKTASDLFHDQAKTEPFKQGSNKHNCEIKSHDDAVQFANQELAKAGDPFTHVMSRQEVEAFEKEIVGDNKISGIGIQFMPLVMDTTSGAGKGAVVTDVFEGGPAAKAGLKSGDQIISIGGKSVKDLNADQITELIKGAEGTQVSIKVDRNGTVKDVFPVRGQVNVPPIMSLRIDDVLYMRINDFVNDRTDQAMKNQLLRNPDAKAIIIDLRRNIGGRVDEMWQVASLLMPTGMLYAQDERSLDDRTNMPFRLQVSINLTEDKLRFQTPDGYVEDVDRNKYLANGKPIFVLSDGMSASASELLIGALKDNKVATIVISTTLSPGSITANWRRST